MIDQHRLDVDAELVVERDGDRFRLWSEDDGGRLVLDAPSLAALRGLDDLESALPSAVTASIPGELSAAGLTVEIQVRRATVARTGAGVTGGPLGRRLTGLDVALVPAGVLTAAVRALG